jgi:hypothetical protein
LPAYKYWLKSDEIHVERPLSLAQQLGDLQIQVNTFNSVDLWVVDLPQANFFKWDLYADFPASRERLTSG